AAGARCAACGFGSAGFDPLPCAMARPDERASAAIATDSLPARVPFILLLPEGSLSWKSAAAVTSLPRAARPLPDRHAVARHLPDPVERHAVPVAERELAL